MDVEPYLQRINYQGTLVPNLDTLRSLHRAHMFSVPFENLDIHLGRKIVLDEELFYEKIVERQRGGFCYELNGLFAQLLREVGFAITVLSARVANGEMLGPEFDHMCLLVQLEERWLADVGFGDSFIEPLCIDCGDAQIERGFSYRISHNEHECTLWRGQLGDEEQRQYVFTVAPRALSEFGTMCHYQQTSPQSHFTQKRICSLATPEGRVSLSDNKLIVTTDGQRTERDLTDTEYIFTLVQRFALDLDLTTTLR
jgi:N-hydroxyarylamine O-acetyltransferase